MTGAARRPGCGTMRGQFAHYAHGEPVCPDCARALEPCTSCGHPAGLHTTAGCAETYRRAEPCDCPGLDSQTTLL